ncbi:MAG: NAD(+) synthase [Crocinitomicaceae bacterium]|nr:NAD(+) synthase [Crocinitomicaceae bacterium]MCF8410901.1 NAD(+) synthase [Crocinitomicaceae bacterium]MCF8444229.1 NAD(+) synthase [Crocinitomicaceae bacterium]
MDYSTIKRHIANWLTNYCDQAGSKGFVIGISGGIDSAVTSTLCALTHRKVVLVNMPIRQSENEYNRAIEHIKDLQVKFPNVLAHEVQLSGVFSEFESVLPQETALNQLAMANTRARIRMTTLYAVAQSENCLVVGTGNKIEDFGIGFFTKYGDGGVDLSPIADLMKSQVYSLGKELGVVSSIQHAAPTDGLWGDNRTDEDQIGATYAELEWAMEFNGEIAALNDRQKMVIELYHRLNRINKHKMVPIPVCIIPDELKVI